MAPSFPQYAAAGSVRARARWSDRALATAPEKTEEKTSKSAERARIMGAERVGGEGRLG